MTNGVYPHALYLKLTRTLSGKLTRNGSSIAESGRIDCMWGGRILFQEAIASANRHRPPEFASSLGCAPPWIGRYAPEQKASPMAPNLAPPPAPLRRSGGLLAQRPAGISPRGYISSFSRTPPVRLTRNRSSITESGRIDCIWVRAYPIPGEHRFRRPPSAARI